MIQEIVKFNAVDGITLDGFFNKCDKSTNKLLIQIHGMTSNCFKYRNNVIAEEVAQLEIDTLGFNNRGSDVAKL